MLSVKADLRGSTCIGIGSMNVVNGSFRSSDVDGQDWEFGNSCKVGPDYGFFAPEGETLVSPLAEESVGSLGAKFTGRL